MKLQKLTIYKGRKSDRRRAWKSRRKTRINCKRSHNWTVPMVGLNSWYNSCRFTYSNVTNYYVKILWCHQQVKYAHWIDHLETVLDLAAIYCIGFVIYRKFPDFENFKNFKIFLKLLNRVKQLNSASYYGVLALGIALYTQLAPQERIDIFWKSFNWTWNCNFSSQKCL